MKNAEVLSKLLSLGAQIDPDAGFSFENFGKGVSGRLGGIQFYYFEEADGVSKSAVMRFFRMYAEGCLMIAQPGGGLIDVYAQSFLDREPVVVQGLAYQKTPEFWGLFELEGYLEFVFELDRRFGRRRLEKKFVAEFKEMHRALAGAWFDMAEDCEADRMQAALDTMLRMFFVAFLAARGTLDHRRMFMVDEAYRCVQEKRSIYRDFIQPLFFETLNCPMRYRTTRARKLGEIPFLNGGLFTPSEIEKRSPHLNSPNEIWLEIIDFFGRYALSTDCSESKPLLHLDPMMLGHVFESLMSKDMRSTTGSYYTPMPLARRIVREAFECYLVQNCALNADEVQKMMDQNIFDFLSVRRAKALELMLADMTVLDPAVGSGAFLQCAFELLHKLRYGLKLRMRQSVHAGQLAREIVSRNLYGVDIVPAANQLCELRLWLELIHFFDEDEVIPSLPNLDLNICCGDSLADLSQYARVLGLASGKRMDEIVPLKSKYKLSTGMQKKKLSAEIHSRMTSAGLEMFREFANALDAECKEIENAGRTLFSGVPAVSFSERRRLDVLRGHRQKLDQAIRSGTLPGFSYDLDFKEILENGGFDMVLGNPPWFSLHTMPEEKQRVLKALYETATGCVGAKLQSADVSALFVEKAIHCVRENGIVTMLVPNKLFHAPSYEKFRKFITSQTVVLKRHDWTNDRSNAFEAATYPASVSMLRTTALETQLESLERQSEREILSGYRVTKMSERFAIRRGICTGANDIFLSKSVSAAADGLSMMEFRALPGNLVPIESDLVHPVLRGSDISAYRAESSEKMLFTHERNAPGLPMRNLPKHAGEWIQRNAEKLRARACMGHKPLHTLFGCNSDLCRLKVVWRDISRNLEACMCQDTEMMPLNTVYYIPVEDEDLGYLVAAWLNSSVARESCRNRAEYAQNDYRRYFAWVVGDLPWIFDTSDGFISQKKCEIIALSKNMHAHAVDIEAAQAQIDQHIQMCIERYRQTARRKKSGTLAELMCRNIESREEMKERNIG